eukprot:1159591-Pelagomonas_calceolata.AAC.7
MEYAATLEPKCHPTAVKKKGAAQVAGGGGEGKKEESWRDMFVGKRLAYGLIKEGAGCDTFGFKGRQLGLGLITHRGGVQELQGLIHVMGSGSWRCKAHGSPSWAFVNSLVANFSKSSVQNMLQSMYRRGMSTHTMSGV